MASKYLLNLLTIALLLATHSTSADVPNLYQRVADKFGLNSKVLYQQALQQTGRKTPFSQFATPWPYTLKTCGQDNFEDCNVVYHKNRANLYLQALAESKARHTIFIGPGLINWHKNRQYLSSNLWLLTNPTVSLNLFAKEVAANKQQKRIYQQLNKQQIDSLVDQTAANYNIDAALVKAIITQESAYNQNAISPAGAVGLMQLMPATGAKYGVPRKQRLDPGLNIRGGVAFLKDLQRIYNGNLKLMLSAYNAGETAVNKFKPDLPPYPETRQYVYKVLLVYLENIKANQG